MAKLTGTWAAIQNASLYGPQAAKRQLQREKRKKNWQANKGIKPKGYRKQIQAGSVTHPTKRQRRFQRWAKTSTRDDRWDPNNPSPHVWVDGKNKFITDDDLLW